MKAKELTKREITAIKKRLTRIYRRSNTETRLRGLVWYNEANNYIKEVAQAMQYKFTRLQIASVLSALSPNNKWERNKIDALNLLQGVTIGKPQAVKVCTFNKNKQKAVDIATGKKTTCEAIKGPKTNAFVQNIAHLDETRVTIDRWHLRACFGTKIGQTDPPTPTPTKYQQLEQVTIETAQKYGLTGYEFQAIIWEQLKKEWKR